MQITIDNPIDFAKKTAGYNFKFCWYFVKSSYLILILAILIVLIGGFVADNFVVGFLVSILSYITFRQIVARSSYEILNKYQKIKCIELTDKEVILSFEDSILHLNWSNLKVFDGKDFYLLNKVGTHELCFIPRDCLIEDFLGKKKVIPYNKRNLQKAIAWPKHSFKDLLMLLSITLVFSFSSFLFYALENRNTISEYKNDYDETKSSEFVLDTFTNVFSNPKEGISKLYSFLSEKEKEKITEKQLAGIFGVIFQKLGKYREKGKFLKIQKSFSMVEKGKITMHGTSHIERKFDFSEGSLWVKLKVKNIKGKVWEISNLSFWIQQKIY